MVDSDHSISIDRLSQELLTELWEECFLRSGMMWGRASSGSMGPLIQAGDRVLVERVRPNRVRFGDVVLFRSAEGLVIHRVVGKRRNHGQLVFLQKGDDNLEAGRVPAAHVLGRARAVEREERLVNLVSGTGRVVQIALAFHSLSTLALKRGGKLVIRRVPLIQRRGLGRYFDRLARAVPRFFVKALGPR
jgi:signal peptidase I